MNKSRKMLIAVAVGAILGVLFAPGKGSDIRKKINQQGKKMSDKLKGFAKSDGKKCRSTEPIDENAEEFI